MASANTPDYSQDYYYYYYYDDPNQHLPDMDCPVELARELPITRKDPGVSYCNQTYDSVVCFPAVPVGSFATAGCPAEVHGVSLNTEGTVHKYCFPNGTWDKAVYLPCIPESFTDLLQQTTSEELLGTANTTSTLRQKESTIDHLYYITIIENLGLVLSIIALLAALFIFYYCRKAQTLLQAIRIHIHMALAITDILQLTLSFTLPRLGSMSQLYPGAQEYSWTCQLIKFFYNYTTCTIYFWLLCEALYFFIIMVWDLNCDTGKFWKYQLLGWGCPFVPVLIWGILQAAQGNIGCDNNVHIHDYIYITPVLLILLLIIIFLVCTTYFIVTTPSTSANSQVTEYTTYKLSMRSALVVFPVLVTVYILYLILRVISVEHDNLVYITFLYILAVVHSLQGLFVAVVYCFVNRQVWNAFKNRPKKWKIRKSNKI